SDPYSRRTTLRASLRAMLVSGPLSACCRCGEATGGDRMIRMVFAAMLGLVVALVVMLCLQYLGLLLLPPPPGIAVESEADLVRLVESESISRKAWLLVSWITASFTGALVAARTGGRRQVGAALSVGCLILAGVLLYVTTTP